MLLPVLSPPNRVRLAFASRMNTPFFRKFASTLFYRHLWGIGNNAADKALRFRNAEAEAIVRGLGLEPKWHALPS